MKNVNFVFHCAATVKFNETLDMATKLNIQGTENVLALAAKMNYLKGFVYVSTAYSHCPRSEIKEEFYPVSISVKDLKKLIEIDEKTSNVLEDWPNTYTFTKALTENMISTNENQLPISVFRPSIIGCTQSEPEPGWMNNVQGLVYVVNSIMLGFLRAIAMSMDKKTDIVPIDYTANALITVMWDTVNRYQDGNEKNKKPKIYNYVSSFDSPVHWLTFFNYVYETYYQAPPLQSIWYIFCIFSANNWFINIMRFLLHRIPAAFVDLSLIICGKNTKMLKIYKKQDKMMDTFEVFMTREWKFDNSNTRKLWALLSQEDRKTFWFGFEDFDWKSYTQTMVYGIRKNILQEDLNNMTRALSKNRKLFWLHQFCIFLIIYIVFQVCWMFVL
ncbi:fatty acyl-CoA reductase wat-like [Metopolophium dirhodum]|uniref:fatty acyl-CoA reductase wat-like n=1 Tax=Metopolophium dirhodum TaxID=44670 RepID=UPI00298FE22E|nr:fatty acyl-CoA reductase wat-like [Metopolophium dirhodum]